MSELERLQRLLEEERQLRRKEQERRLEEQERRLEEQERRLEEEQRRKEIEKRLSREQQLREEEQELREEEQRLRKEEQRLREEEKQQHDLITGPTTLLELLNACHDHMYSGLTIQADSSQSTKGLPTNADRKLRPRKILPWTDFADHQKPVWDTLMASDFVWQRLFTSLNTIQEQGTKMLQRQLSSELDLHHFARSAVEDQVSEIVNQILQDEELQDLFGLRGAICFANHANIGAAQSLADRLSDLKLESETKRRRSPRLSARRAAGRHANTGEATQTPSSTSSRKYPSADQFCVHSVPDEASGAATRKIILLLEYKSAHKLTLGHLYAGLKSIDVDDVVQERVEEDVDRRCERLVAAIITQAYSYMISAGLETSAIFTGQAFIFLRVCDDDPASVYYSLSVPHGDVGADGTGWSDGQNRDNRLHLTAVSQLLAFTIRAMQLPIRDEQWRHHAQEHLVEWGVELEELESSVPEAEMPSSEYRPPQDREHSFVAQSPIVRRFRKPRLPKGSDIPSIQHREDKDGDDGESDGAGAGAGTSQPVDGLHKHARARDDRSSRRGGRNAQRGPRGKGDKDALEEIPSTCPNVKLPFCTPECLRGLRFGGPLDPMCPNTALHGAHRHAIDFKKFRRLVSQTLRTQPGRCREYGLWGARGCLYRIQLPWGGYTLLAKAVNDAFSENLRHEARVYRRLEPLQGRYVPVCLGMFKLPRERSYLGLIPVHRLMLLSFDGASLLQRLQVSEMREKGLAGLRAIHALGVLHGDVASRNVLYDKRQHRIVWHDFDRAILCAPQANSVLNKPALTRKPKRYFADYSPKFRSELFQAESVIK